MSVPEPLLPLQEHCSVIHDNILYIYSPDGLQSLPLQIDGTWAQESAGVSVTGASCVLGTVDGNHGSTALYIVGGSADSSSPEYPGLQRYSFRDEKWDTITPVTPVTRNRKRHGAAFLNDSSSILVYAGSQNGDSSPSTQTFVIDTWPPYNVRSFTSIAPPVVDPVMLSWSESHVAMIGGSPTNDQIFTFGPDDGWSDAGVTLTQTPPNRSVAQSQILDLDDQSKILITIDSRKSPNQVARTVVLDAGGQPAPYGKTVGANDSSSKLRRKDVLLSSFPSYNESLAPTTARTDASMAQDPNGLTVISGGDGEDSLSIFHALENRWISVSELLGDQSQNPPEESPTSSTPISTASSSSTSTAATGNLPTPPLTILAIVLGSVCGMAALLIIALLLLRYFKRKNLHSQPDSDFSSDKQRKRDRLSFEDQSLQPIKPAAQPMGRSIPASVHDMPVLEPRVSYKREIISRSSRSGLDPKRSSDSSSDSTTLSRTKGPQAISQSSPHKEPAEHRERPMTNSVRPSSDHPAAPPHSTHRKMDSSWSTYFSGNTAPDIREHRRTADSTGSGASSSSGGSHRQNTSTSLANMRSATPALTDSRGNPLEKLNVYKGSPVISHSGRAAAGQGVAVRESVPGHISHTDSLSPSMANGYHDITPSRHPANNDSAYTGSPLVDDCAWAFQDRSWPGPPRQLIRPPSSSYTNSIQPLNVTTSREDDWPLSSIRPVTQWPRNTLSFSLAQSSRPSIPPGQKVPSGDTQPTERVRNFFGAHRHREAQHSDTSWLNLNSNIYADGDEGRGHRS